MILLKDRAATPGFTLVELMVAVIVVGVLVSLGVPGYITARERSLDPEALNGIRVIWLAQRQMISREGQALVSSNITVLNQGLSLDLVEDNWDYNVTGSATAPNIDIIAGRRGRTWQTNLANATYVTMSAPACSGACV